MKGANDSAGQKDGGREERSLGCGANFDQLEPREKEPDHHGCEYFKEALNPEVNYPPAPIFGGNKMAALTVHQASRIKERNRNAGDEEERQKRAVFTLANERRFESRDHQDKPKNQSDEQKNLPEASEIDIFITLAAKPEPHVAKTLLDTHPLAGKRASDHENQCTEECIDTQSLILRFVTADSWTNVKACSQP